jgi:hypothetical protein
MSARNCGNGSTARHDEFDAGSAQRFDDIEIPFASKRTRAVKREFDGLVFIRELRWLANDWVQR